MGTSTIFQRFNDFGGRLSQMSKEDLEKIDAAKDDGGHLPVGWRVGSELHNGNIDVLVWWNGQLMRLDDAPKNLSKKYYDRYSGKALRIYEWTVFKNFCQTRLEHADKEFRKSLRKLKIGVKGTRISIGGD